MKITLAPILAVFIFTGFLFSSIPNTAHAASPAGGGCSGVVWEYTYTLVTNPFPPNSPGEAAFRALYGGDSYTVQSTYQVARIGDIDEGCIEEPTTPTAGIIAVPSAIDTGGSSSLSWSSTYATSCTGTNFSTGGATSGSLIVSPADSTVYSVTCTDGTQSASSNASVTVNPPPGPTATLNASPGTVSVGAQSTLTWTSTNAISCTGSGFDTSGNVTGSVSTGPLSVTTNYSITCTGASSSVTTSGTSGTWQLSYNDISDFFCNAGVTRVSTPYISYSGLANCPSSPTGKPCNGVGDQNVCKINVANDACQIETAVYQCAGATGTAPTTVVTPGLTASASAVVYVTSSSLSASCSPSSPTVSPGSAITWTVVVSGGSGGSVVSGGSGDSGGLVWRRGTAFNTKICTGGTNYTSLDTNTCSEDTSDGDACSVEGSKCKVSAGCDGNTYTDGEGQTNAHTTYGSVIPYTCTATGSGSSSSSYSYSWSGTDGLSGTSALVEKIYTTLGIKTASVVVTDTTLVNTTSTVTTPGTTTTTTTPGAVHVLIQGGMQCSGGTHVASANDTQDGVGFTGGVDATLGQVCSEITPSGGCCNVEVREVVDPTGQPVNTYYWYNSYSGSSVVQKDSTSLTVGGNGTNYNYFAGIAAGGTPVTTTTNNPGTDTTTTNTTSSTASVTANCSALVCTGIECIFVPPSCTGPSCPTTPPACTGPSCPTTPPTPPTPPTSSGVSALLTAFPTTVVYGAPSLLSWTSARAVSCTGGNFNTGGRTSGTLSVTPTDTTLYTLTCTDASGNRAFSTATVTVIAPTLSIIATPQLVRSGDPSTITWFAGGRVNACTVSGPGLSSSLTAGSKSVVITAESIFTFSCTAGSLRPSVSTSVKILPAFREQ